MFCFLFSMCKFIVVKIVGLRFYGFKWIFFLIIYTWFPSIRLFYLYGKWCRGLDSESIRCTSSPLYFMSVRSHSGTQYTSPSFTHKCVHNTHVHTINLCIAWVYTPPLSVAVCFIHSCLEIEIIPGETPFPHSRPLGSITPITFILQTILLINSQLANGGWSLP